MSRRKVVDIGTLIHFPASRHGRPCLAGTGMTVYRVVNLHKMGMTPEQMQAGIPDIPLSHFYAAMAFYFANRARVDQDMNALETEGLALADENARQVQATKAS